MAEEKKDYSDILFGYLLTPAYGFFGMDDGGFSVAIYPDGRLVHKTYVFDRREKTRTEYLLPDEVIEQIAVVLEEYAPEIADFDEHVSNGSLDGYGNFFVFNGKHIISWNIELNDEEEVRKKNPEYYHEYLSVMQQENTMLFIFYEVIEILEKIRIKLNLHEVEIPEEYML